MKLTLAEPKYLKDSISIISDLVNEARFKITQDAIERVAMDPANVAMVMFKLLSSAFVEYEVSETVEIAINLGNLKQVLRRCKPADMLSLEMIDNKLKVTFKSNTTRSFSLPIIEIEE
ncbi:DNA polymerase sliding clamp, partial [Candidatus Woesearchaeota archaeon]|nr:DNA polymerase sliding clamp [Candidatus Woesearchaeota archaeon]